MESKYAAIIPTNDINGALVWGTGTTAMDALKDARQWIDGEDSKVVAVRCSAKAYDMVQSFGGDAVGIKVSYNGIFGCVTTVEEWFVNAHTKLMAQPVSDASWK